MVQLNGTEKQIAWAESIRAYILDGDKHVHSGLNDEIKSCEKNVLHYAEKCERKGINKETHFGYMSSLIRCEKLKEYKTMIESETSAAWFIENRSKSVDMIVGKSVDKELEERGITL